MSGSRFGNRWPPRRRPRRSDGAEGPKKRETRWPARIVTGIFVAAALVAIGKFVVPAVDNLLSGDDGAPRLQVEARVVDRETERGLISLRSEPTPSTAPQVDLYIRNEGDGSASLGQVEVTIQHAVQLDSCIPPQGGGPALPPIVRPYYINLPISPLPGERHITRSLDQTVEAEGAVPVHLIFRTLEDEQLDQVYLLKLRLVPDDGAPIDLGRFLLSLPGAINRTGAWLPEDARSLENLRTFHDRLASTWCYRRNVAIVHELLPLDARSSAPMKALSAARPAPSWASFADPLPARAAAVRLLKSIHRSDQAPTLAVYAAERAGDRTFEASIRRRAAGIDLEQAEELLEDEGDAVKTGLFRLREALAIEPSAEAEELLPRAEAELRQAEHVTAELGY